MAVVPIDVLKEMFATGKIVTEQSLIVLIDTLADYYVGDDGLSITGVHRSSNTLLEIIEAIPSGKVALIDCLDSSNVLSDDLPKHPNTGAFLEGQLRIVKATSTIEPFCHRAVLEYTTTNNPTTYRFINSKGDTDLHGWLLQN